MHDSKNIHQFIVSIIWIIILAGCQSSSVEKDSEHKKLFENILSDSSGVTFENRLIETPESNYYQYLYTYIGGGVASGDINKDGLDDLYFTSNQAEDRLYLNKGNFVFEDITETAGIRFNEGFNTGVTMVDVNSDGLLDIYVSRGGWKDEENFKNLLYINNGDLTFTEKANEHGLDDPNRSIQSTFFDYDQDGDLDVYISNTPNVTGRSQILNLEEVHRNPETLKLLGSDRLYENDGQGFFTDASENAGLVNDIGFGLNPQVTDLNQDGWLDIYVCNDFNYPDLVYINNGDKTFTESRDKYFNHMSYNSMGSDAADLNNDGYLDVVTLDMNPDDYVRSKTTMSMLSVSRFEEMVEKGYHYQYMHNMLQLNNGIGTFSEIGNMAGIANTDWSWSILSADFDLDGWNDIYITNGVYRDVLDQDKNIEIRNTLRERNRKPTNADLLEYTRLLPQQKLKNFLFRNNADLTFEDVSSQWTNEVSTFSNGATYSDLDNDGDLDIIVNNINDPATLLKNHAVESDLGNYIVVNFKDSISYVKSVGAKIELKFEDGSFMVRENIPTRGYLSSVPGGVYFGFKNKVPTSIKVTWSDRTEQLQAFSQVNKMVELEYNPVGEKDIDVDKTMLFSLAENFHTHKEIYYNDYDLQILLPHKFSQTGPGSAIGDVNNDGRKDIYIGGAHQQPGVLLISNHSGNYIERKIKDFEKDAVFEDQGAVFFDVENDGDLDLYVSSGSYEFTNNPAALQDRFYRNDGHGNFSKDLDILPLIRSSASEVISFDYEGDGDLDLFIGGRIVPGKYPFPAQSKILINEGGVFEDKSESILPNNGELGLVTDVALADLNKDGKYELLVTGEWMGLLVLENRGNQLIESDDYPSLNQLSGWWNKIKVADVDGDSDFDIIAGNVGLNTKFTASSEKPFKIYTDDFDLNGTIDVVLAKEYEGKDVPIRGKTCMTQQMPYLADKIKTYDEFATSNISDILGADLSESLTYKANEFRSGIFINNGSNDFTFKPFGNMAQSFPINAILFEDLDMDGTNDLLLAGNHLNIEVETTRRDAGIGLFLKGNANGNFSIIPNAQCGLNLGNEVKNLHFLDHSGHHSIVVVRNNGLHERWSISLLKDL